MSLLQHLQPGGPKRILALDGGGIRGALTLGYLQKIEDLLREQHSHIPDFRLCDYFDLIGGTSTGSIISAGLAIGMKVEEIKNMYFDLGGKIFGKRFRWWNVFRLEDMIKAKYDAAPLDEALQKTFKDITLGSGEIKTGLCIVAKRADTNSVWPLINHPDGKFYDSNDGKNKDILLWKAVRASAAAPTYFLPQLVDVGGGSRIAAFVDGAVSMANNPALQLLMVATLKGFPFRWKLGAENLFIVSVGTGLTRRVKLAKQITDNDLLKWAKEIPDMLIQDATWQNQIILQWLSASPTRWEIDSEIGKMENDLLVVDTDSKGLISYVRYDKWLDGKTLDDLMGKTYAETELDEFADISNASTRFELYEIGCKAASQEVDDSHFPESFKIK